MKSTYRKTMPALVMLVLVGFVPPSHAGTITFGGDLAAALGGPIATPAVLGAGVVLDVPFATSVPGTGSVQGTVHLRNDGTATHGGMEINNFVFRSFRPAGAGGIAFTLAVDQDFAYAGPPRINLVDEVAASATFTGFPQGASIDGFPLAATSGGPFPEVQNFDVVGDGFGLPASSPLHLRLNLSLGLSDNALGDGPRITQLLGSMSIERLGYDPAPVPVPEPSTGVLLGCGVIGLLGAIIIQARLPYLPMSASKRRWLTISSGELE
jgi:hypothetical protein